MTWQPRRIFFPGARSQEEILRAVGHEKLGQQLKLTVVTRGIKNVSLRCSPFRVCFHHIDAITISAPTTDSTSLKTISDL
jgi:hypothetical protein